MKTGVHVIFDLDGTLVDTAPIVEKIINEIRYESGMGQIDKDKLCTLMSLGGIPMMKGALGTNHEDTASAALDTFRSRYAQLTTPTNLVYQDAPEVLKNLSLNGVYLSICTNKPRNLALKVLSETSLMQYFQFVCAGDDLPTLKPNKLNLIQCLKSSNYDWQQIYLVGDSSIDEALAYNSNVPFLFFSSGYDDGVNLRNVSFNFSSYSEFPNINVLQR